MVQQEAVDQHAPIDDINMVDISAKLLNDDELSSTIFQNDSTKIPLSSIGFNNNTISVAYFNSQKHGEQELQAMKNDSQRTNQAEIKLRTKQAKYAHCMPLYAFVR